MAHRALMGKDVYLEIDIMAPQKKTRQKKKRPVPLSDDPRAVALDILLINQKTRRPLDAVLEESARKLDPLSGRDRSLANALIYGTLRWQGHLDWILQAFSDRPLESLSPDTLYILRLALFQILLMDRIPVSAAVNTAVENARKRSHKGVAGFVNAVLRRASTDHATVALPDASSAPEERIAVETSMPTPLVRRWIARFGIEKTRTLCQSINEIPPITIRVNTLKSDRERLMEICRTEVDTIFPTLVSDVGISFHKPFRPIFESDAFKAGLFQVQDEAAQLVTEILAPKPGDTVLDACAGLGGKSGHIAQQMENQGRLVAGDTDPIKLERLKAEMVRLGITIVETRPMDLTKTTPADFDSTLFDRVLVDAPCSGLGVLRRNPDAKWKLTKKDIARLAIRQQAMLIRAADLVKPGGRLVFAVCSCETRENEDVMTEFLKAREDFVIAPPFENNETIAKRQMVAEEGFMRTYPDHLAMDGFFAVALTRKK